MRTLRKNKQKLIYSAQTGDKIPVYETDENGDIAYEGYTDEDGNFIPILDDDGNKIPKETGDYMEKYGTPVIFNANISFGGSDTKAEYFGLDMSSYDATIMTVKNAFPIKETSVIWHESEPSYIDDDKTIPDPKSADYQVKKKIDSLNFTVYALDRRIK